MNKKNTPLIIGIILIILCALFFGLSVYFTRTPELPEIDIPSSTKSELSEKISTEYVSPIDFGGILEKSPDVIGWLDISGTDISYPVVFRPDDNDYYLRRDIYGNYSKAGSLFIENYNSPNFNDPVTVIYGHHLSSGEMFGKLQEIYTNSETFFEHNEFTVYLPEKELHYRVFCAVPLDNSHILYYHNFNNKNIFENYFKEIFETRSLLAVFDNSVELTPDDRVVMFSTCFESDYSRRFVVMGVCID